MREVKHNRYDKRVTASLYRYFGNALLEKCKETHTISLKELKCYLGRYMHVSTAEAFTVISELVHFKIIEPVTQDRWNNFDINTCEKWDDLEFFVYG